MSGAVRRAPELRPALLGGRALPAVRAMRVAVDADGAVVVSRPGAGRQVVAVPGQAHRLVLLRDDDAVAVLGRRGAADGVLVLLSTDGRPLLALRLLEWSPPAPLDMGDLLGAAGVRALGSALGLPVEPAEPGLLAPRAVRAALLSPVPAPPWPGRAATPLGVVGLLLAILGLIGAATTSGLLMSAAALLLSGAVLLAGARARRPGPPPSTDTAGRHVLTPRPSVPLPAAQLDVRLEVGSDDVVIGARGREVWLPGPARGGVRTAVVDPHFVCLLDASGTVLASLALTVWAGDEPARAALARDLAAAGLDAHLDPVGCGVAATVGGPGEAGLTEHELLSDGERGDATLTAPVLHGTVVLAAGLGGLAHGLPFGPLLLVAALALLAVRLHDAARRTQRTWAQRRLVLPASAAEAR